MRKRIISMLFVLSAFIVPASVQAQWVVSDPGNLVQGIVNSVNEIVETSETAQNALSTWKETSKIFEQGREYYDKLRKVNDLISGSEKVKESVLMLGDISEIYVNNFGKMLTDKNTHSPMSALLLPVLHLQPGLLRHRLQDFWTLHS